MSRSQFCIKNIQQPLKNYVQNKYTKYLSTVCIPDVACRCFNINLFYAHMQTDTSTLQHQYVNSQTPQLTHIRQRYTLAEKRRGRSYIHRSIK